MPRRKKDTAADMDGLNESQRKALAAERRTATRAARKEIAEGIADAIGPTGSVVHLLIFGSEDTVSIDLAKTDPELYTLADNVRKRRAKEEDDMRKMLATNPRLLQMARQMPLDLDTAADPKPEGTTDGTE